MKFIINYHKTSKNDSKKGKNIIYISIARNYAENRKLRGRLLITRSASRPRNRVFGWALPTRHAGNYACGSAGHLDFDDFLKLYVWNKVLFNKLSLWNLTSMLRASDNSSLTTNFKTVKLLQHARK
jgi:hypothetical protein